MHFMLDGAVIVVEIYFILQEWFVAMGEFKEEGAGVGKEAFLAWDLSHRRNWFNLKGIIFRGD